jgi:hypothetical protein
MKEKNLGGIISEAKDKGSSFRRQVDRLASRTKFGARIDGGTKRSVAVSYFQSIPAVC